MLSLFCHYFDLTPPIGVNRRSWLIELYLENENELFKRQDSSFYGTSNWKKLRATVLEHYGSKCMKCGSREDIIVDHIKPRSIYKELELDFNNMQVLCNTCNLIKSNRQIVDYRPKQLLTA